MNLFKTLQVPEAQRYWIGQARVPICFLPGGPKTAVDRDGATLIALLVDNEKIAAIEPAGVAASADLPAIDLEAHYVWPTLIDMHAHLDKGHIVTRTENPDGSFAGALKSAAADRSHRGTAEDIKRRMEFGLRCAYIHGVAAIRTHLDSPELNQAQRSWQCFARCGPSGRTASCCRPSRWCRWTRSDPPTVRNSPISWPLRAAFSAA